MADNLFQQSPYAVPDVQPLKVSSVDAEFSDTPPALKPVERTSPSLPADRSGLPAGMRNNNPGNIKYVGQRDAVGPSKNLDQGDPQAVYQTPEDGMAAMFRLALRKYNGGKVSPNLIIASQGGWTPGNRKAAENIAATMGIGPDDDINLNDPNMMHKFGRALMLQEHGPSSKLYSDDMIKAAVAKVAGQPSSVNTAGSYSSSVAQRLAKARKAPNIDDQFSDTPPAGSIDDQFSDEPVTPSATPNAPSMPSLTQADVENKPYLDRLAEETKAGFGDMARSLNTARWALGGGDPTAIAEDMAQSFQQQSATPKTKAQQEIDAAYKGVTDAQGVVDTTVAGAKALWASITNPKETSIEIARNAANSLPTLGAGAAGAVGGGVVGSAVPVVGTAAGAIAGGRSGMVLGTTATELGAEIQDMVQKRLADGNQAPTAQNILAILNDKDFQSAALKQGAAKGLTVAAVDQLFMGLGGKIATAPARKIASKELADQGMDMATRTARKAALASPAGQAAIAAAKPALGAKVAAGTAAVAVDAAGESIGEGLSQKVARGEVDYGDALREGVVSIGQSVAETAAGATIETAKQAAASAKGAVAPTAKAPSTASGPLARATENAAAEPDRVTVTAPDGQVSGTVTGQTADAVQIVGDDGQVYNFKTGPDGVKITPEAPNTPLSNALEVAASENANPVGVPQEIRTPNDDGSVSVATWTPQPDGSFTRSVRIEPAPEQTAEVPAPAPVTQSAVPAEPPKEPLLTDMSEDELRARLKYIADQAKTNGGWNKMLVEQRRLVEKEINARAPKVETPKVEQPSLDLKPAEPTGKQSLQVEPVAEATPAQEAAATLPKELSGAKPRYAYGKKAFELNFESDIDRAAYITAQEKTSSRDADYLAFVAKQTGMSEAEVRAHGAQVREAIKAMAKDASPGTLKVPVVKRGVKVEKTDGALTYEGTKTVSQPAPTGGTSEEGAGVSQPTQAAPIIQTENKTEPAQVVREQLSKSEQKDNEAKPKTASKADLEHLFGIDKKREKALERIAAGKAWFNDGVKAKDFIAKNGLKDTHEVVKGKGGRFDIVAKQKMSSKFMDTDSDGTANFGMIPMPETGKGIVAKTQQPKNTNVSNTDTSGKPASTEAVVSSEEAKPATAAAVQPEAAKKEVAPADEPGKPEPAAADATSLQRTEAEIAEWKWRRSLPINVGQHDLIDGEIAKLEEAAELLKSSEKTAKQEAPGTRINGEAERAAADRLEKLHEQMGNITNRNSREGNAKAAVRSVIDELRKSKTVTSVEAILEKASTDLTKNYGAFADVIDEVVESLSGKKQEKQAAPLDAMAQGADDAKAGKPRTPPAGMTAKQRFQWTQGYDGEAGTTPPSQQPKTDTSKFANNKLFTADAVEKARARLRSKLGNLNSGIDPEVVIDGMTLAGAYIEAGTRSFAAYAKAMVDDFGPKIKPYLLSFYEAARNYPGLDTEGMTPVSDAKSEFDALLTGSDLAEVKDAVGEKAPAPAKRAKKTGSSADATLTQDFGVEQINGYGDNDREVGNSVKDAFLKDARSYLKAVADILTQRGFMAHIDRKGKAMNPVNVNESGMAGSGDVSLALRLPEIGSGIYVHIGDTALRGMVPMTPSGIAVMFRATTEKDPYGGKQNRWAPTDLSAADFADMLEKEARQYAKEPNNGPQKLDQSGPRELEGKQPDALQGAEPVGQAGASSAAGSGADARGNERAGSSGNEQPGRLGNDAGEVSSLAARRNARRGGEQGGGSVSGSDGAAKPNPANAERGNQRELIPTDGTRAQDRADDFTITDEDAIGEGGQKTKFKQNVAAIRILKQLQAEGRQATRAEQAALAKYVGWGGIPQAFYRDNGEVSKGWEKEAAELKELMTPDELAAAASSTRNAHYTSPEIVAAVWDAAKHFGFQGGRVLEPSVGVGNFFGLMPSALRSASQLTGVELDHITGGIAKQLYPAANIQAPVAFQDFTAPDNYFDLAIGNPPFGREGIYDANRRKISGFSIHNYFFAKSIDTVKPNGVLAMVVTNRLLDSMGDKARQYIADRAEFLGAIRLPNNAFLKNAGTEVTTDIIFLRKLKDGEQPTGQRWMEVKQVTDKNGKTVPLNEYFVRNPDMMLGEFGAFGSMYSPDDAALVARPGQDTPKLLREAMAKLPAGFMDPPTAEPTRETIEPMNDVSHVKVGSVFEQAGQIFERREDMLGKQQAAPVTFASEKAKERVSGMIKVRDALIAVRRLQLTEGVSDKALEDARAGLNKAYDAFVKTHGPINGEANKRLMRDDPTWPQLAALEDDFDKGITPAVAKTTGEKARPPSAKKAAIFFKRTQSPYKAPEKAATAKDALVTSLAERGRVDLDYMASLYGKTPDAIANELEGLIFEVVPGDYVTREEYLSGNVKKRLALTIELAKKFSRFQKNVDALRQVQPADIEAVDIDVKTGAHWVPADVMQAFVGHITEGQNVKAIYNPITATWTLDADRVPQSAMTQWGTDRANVLKVLEAAANQKQITIFDEHRDGTRTMNEAATTAANEKVERVKTEWKSWIWADDARRTRLHRIYNDTFNTDVQRDYDGSHLTFPGKVGNDIISLRPHQANAVWRMVQSGTTLLDHVVGAGKTFTMIAGVMEMRRMGLAKKPMLVVPNHLVGQWAEDFMKLYPGANILAATKKDFEKDNRKKLFARIATGDWDAVIVAHSSFGKVEVEPEFQEAFIRQQINDMDTSISAMRAAEGKSSRNVKQIEKQKAALEEKLKRLFDTGSKDDNLYFGELGVDAVFVDEAHEFKNLGFSTGMQRVAGLGNPTGSNKAADMFMKVQSVLKRTGGKNVVFATGTPISNTMAEMYTMQRYLDYQTLKDQGIAHFDAWAKTFGEVVTDWELSPSGQYKMNSRFAKFVNMPELMQRYQSFADVINRDDINRQLAEQGKKLPVPKVATGKPENIVVDRSQDQARYIGIPTVDENGVETYPQGSLVWRAENLPKKAEKGADNMLKIMSDARKAALDMRLIAPGYPDNPNSKVNVAAQNIKATYDQWEKDKGTQLVFIDLSTPKGAVAKEAAALRELVRLAEEGDEAAQEKLDAMSPDELLALDSSFSVYDDLKAKLIGLGIPEKEIAFIHDANTELQKEELFAKVRTGRVRVLFGSTAKMGAGMNVQERLVALHHLDAPWRPSDLEQREGRIIRQGNKLYDAKPEGFEVRILRYATKQTLDSRMWQTIEAKARFIEQVRKGAGNTREIEDIGGEAANSAEMKAASSGNPLILEEMSLRQAIRKLENSQAEHNREQHRIKDRMRWLTDAAKRTDAEAVVMEADAPKAPEKFTVKIGKQTFDKHGEAGDAILNAVDAMHKAGEDSRELGTYGGFKLRVDDTSIGQTKQAVLTIIGEGEYQIEANPGSAATGLALRMQNTVKGLGDASKRAREQAQRDRSDIAKLDAQIKPWGQDQELADAKARHAAVIEQLKPKKKEQPKQDGEAPAMSRTGLEPIFEALEGRGLTRKRALDALANTPEGEKIAYINQNFWDILGELEDKGLVNIKC